MSETTERFWTNAVDLLTENAEEMDVERAAFVRFTEDQQKAHGFSRGMNAVRRVSEGWRLWFGLHKRAGFSEIFDWQCSV